MSAALPNGCRSTAADRRSLEVLLPESWRVARFEFDTSDGARSGAWKLSLEHADGARLYCRPVDTREVGPTVYNGHRIVRILDDGSREVLVEAADHLTKQTRVFGAVLAAAEAFSDRYQLFHSNPSEQ